MHLELPVARETFKDFHADTDKRQFIDLVVSDMRSFESDGPAESAEERFTTRRHEIFVEAKYFPSGCSGRWKFDHVRKVKDVVADANRLARHLERGHRAVAAVLVVDDDNLFEELAATTTGRRLSRCSSQARASWPPEPRPAAADAGPPIGTPLAFGLDALDGSF